MGRGYEIHGSDTNTDNTTIIGLTSAATIRPTIYEVIVGSRAAPADNACGYEFQRYTAAGTSTAITPTALDPADPTALASAGQAHTVEPTYTAGAFVLYIPLNMRPTFRWVAVSIDKGLRAPATAANGIGVLADVPTTAFVAHIMIHFEE